MVYVISGGPGSIDYLPYKSVKILKEADLVVYYESFDLSELLTLCKPSCVQLACKRLRPEVRINVFKNNPDKICVYLITGDFSLFGTCQHILDMMDANNIPYEIIPGISAFSASASVLKRELVLPGISQCCIFTYLEDIPVLDKQQINSLACHHSTLVVFMPYEYLLPKLESSLLSVGVSPDTPVRIVANVLSKNQEILDITVKDIHDVRGNVWHSLFLIGWVFADADVRKKVSLSPYTIGFRRTEDYFKNKEKELKE